MIKLDNLAVDTKVKCHMTNCYAIVAWSVEFGKYYAYVSDYCPDNWPINEIIDVYDDDIDISERGKK